MRLILGAAAALLLLPAAGAQVQVMSDVLNSNKYSWQENCGWMNWHDADGGFQGVLVWPSFLSGFVWCENIGWINLGNSDTALDNAGSYPNTDGTTTGVNLDPGTGHLSGYAWGENVGWINFSGGALATPPNHARYVPSERRFRGYAWGENIGWVNLDDNEHYVGVKCPADYNGDGFVNGDDYDIFAEWFDAGSPHADHNRDGFVNGDDYDLFAEAFEAGC